jgi:hypothetical protein
MILGLRGASSCGIRDLTDDGAGLRLNGTTLLPIDFKLSFDGVRHVFDCRLVWRSGDFAGLAFQPSKPRQFPLESRGEP